jgi:hypothetical protein
MFWSSRACICMREERMRRGPASKKQRSKEGCAFIGVLWKKWPFSELSGNRELFCWSHFPHHFCRLCFSSITALHCLFTFCLNPFLPSFKDDLHFYIFFIGIEQMMSAKLQENDAESICKSRKKKNSWKYNFRLGFWEKSWEFSDLCDQY